MIKPSPGRIVWYRARSGEGLVAHHDAPLAAIVCAVLDFGRVNLSVFDANGGQHPRLNVTLVQEGEPAPGQACWMPYQRGQAAKLDELKDKLQATVERSNSAAIITDAEDQQPAAAELQDPEKNGET